MSESAIVARCLEWLAIRRIFAWRNNTGALKIDGRWIRYGHPGSSDILAVTPVVITPEMVGRTVGVFTAIECKTEAGSQRANQKMFQKMVENAGGRYVLARGPDDLERHLVPLP
jgi:hypothetical protein